MEQKKSQHASPSKKSSLQDAKAEACYRQQVVEAYRRLRFSGFDQSDLSLAEIPLEAVFVRLTLSVERHIRPIATFAHRGDPRHIQPAERTITVHEPLTVQQALTRHCLLTGEPGAGKSTLLRWLAVTFASKLQQQADRLGQDADPDRLPILIELRYLPARYLDPQQGETIKWTTFLPSYLANQEAFPGLDPNFISRTVAAGRCLILFDGLDEIADPRVRERLAQAILELDLLAPGNRIIIGSRPAGLAEAEAVLHPRLFERCRVERFTPDDVQQFFQTWYALDIALSEEQRHQEVSALVEAIRHIPGLRDLTATPLLCTMLLLLWRNQATLPERRVALYERCCRLLLESWELPRGGISQQHESLLDWEQQLRILAPIAYFIHQQERRTTISRAELLPVLADSLVKQGYCAEPAARRTAEQVLHSLGRRSGLFQYQRKDEENNELYGFAHLTFQEYLTACHLASLPDPAYIDRVMEHLYEAWWQQAHLLTIGCLAARVQDQQRASTLLLTILNQFPPPPRPWRASPDRFFRQLQLGKYLHRLYLARQLMWATSQNIALASRAILECPPALQQQMTAVEKTLSHFLPRLVRRTLDGDLHDKEILHLVIQALPQQGNKMVIAPLVSTIYEDTYKRLDSIHTLGELGIKDQAIVQALLAALHGSDSLVQYEAAESLVQLGIKDQAVVQVLLATLHDSVSVVDISQVTAAESLVQLSIKDQAVVQTLLTALHGSEPLVRYEAAKSLVELVRIKDKDQAVVQALLAALHGSVSVVDISQVTAAESLVQLSIKDQAVVQTLLTTLHDSDSIANTFQITAAKSLVQLGIKDQAVVQVLLRALRGSDWIIRLSTAKDLGELGIKDQAVVQALLTALRDSNSVVGCFAARSLGQLGIKDQAVVQALLTALHDSESAVRIAAAESLGQLGVKDEAVIQALLMALHNFEQSLSQAAAESLGQLGTKDQAIVQALLTALHDSESAVRGSAAKGLGKLGIKDQAVVQALLTALRDSHRQVRFAAAESLAQLGIKDQVVVEALLAALHSRDSAMREAAAESLGQIEIQDTSLLRRVLSSLTMSLYDWDWNDYRHSRALQALRRLLGSRPFPELRWIPLAVRRARQRRLKRTAFWLGAIAVCLLIALGATWFSGYLDPNSFFLRFVGIVAAGIAFLAAIVQIRGWALRDPWEHP